MSRLSPDTYDDPKTFPRTAWELAAFREEWRKLGPWHVLVDRWRFDLGWHIEPSVVRVLLERDWGPVH